ncbi:MAG: hypothetical protein M1831_000597 [Alyxoria varia]|nr:MAG: hypothetical protein M1831_000597 [Alyxoria varia]
MSFGLSVSDLRIAYELASFLYQKCFTRAQGADVQYLRFGRDIDSFAGNLHSLINVIKHANHQRPQRPWGNHDNECRQTLQPLSQAVGDFNATLRECDKLLNDRSRFQRDKAGFVDNVQWHMSTQRDVDILRERVHFHATKLLVLTKPFELHLLLEIRQELQKLSREVAEIRGLLITVLANENIPESSALVDLSGYFVDIKAEIEHRFPDALLKDAPESFDGTDMPLSEGFDALVYQFARSTVEFNPGPDVSQKVPEETQFLNLLKSKWIMEKLEDSVYFRSAGPTSLWGSYLREIKSDIIREYRRFDFDQLSVPPTDAIVRLPDQSFEVWATTSPPLCPPDLAEQRPLEDSILELELPGSVGSFRTFLNVFRRSPIEFRFVNSTKDLNNIAYHQQEEFIVNTNAMRVIPAYAVADANNILLSSSQFQDMKWQSLRNASDVETLQQALTGYRVHAMMPEVSWSFNGSSKPLENGKGKLQLWQLKTLPSPTDAGVNIGAQDAAPMSPAESSVSSARRRQSSALSNATTMFSGSSATSVVTGSRSNGTAILAPEPPVMVLFTALEGRYAFIHLELDEHTTVNANLCDCRKRSKKECTVAVLESSKSKYISIRRLRSQQGSAQGLYTWDLARFRMPRHPDFNSVEVVPKVKYLRLDFPTVGEKDEFCDELALLERVRNMEIKMYKDILEEKRRRARRPERR